MLHNPRRAGPQTGPLPAEPVRRYRLRTCRPETLPGHTRKPIPPTALSRSPARSPPLRGCSRCSGRSAGRRSAPRSPVSPSCGSPSDHRPDTRRRAPIVAVAGIHVGLQSNPGPARKEGAEKSLGGGTERTLFRLRGVDQKEANALVLLADESVPVDDVSHHARIDSGFSGGSNDQDGREGDPAERVIRFMLRTHMK